MAAEVMATTTLDLNVLLGTVEADVRARVIWFT